MSEGEIYFERFMKWNVMQFVDSKSNIKVCQPYICGKFIMRRLAKFNYYQCECGHRHNWENDGKYVMDWYVGRKKTK